MANSITVTNKTNHNDYLKTKIDTAFHFQQVDENHLLNIINNLTPKTSSGIGNLFIKHIKVIKNELVKPLTLITNQVLCTGIFPDKLKIAKVIPIFKKGDDTDLNNYRPISLLPAISKIIEKVIYNQTYNYFDNNKIFYAHQYGFRKQHSTELAVLELVEPQGSILGPLLFIINDLPNASDIFHSIMYADDTYQLRSNQLNP